MIRTAFQMRLERAHNLVGDQAVHPAPEPGHFTVDSQTIPGLVYDVTVEMSEETVLLTHCQCPDWQRMHDALYEYDDNPGISHVDYSPACKHVLSVLIEGGVVK
jgi:hypothetical protein